MGVADNCASVLSIARLGGLPARCDLHTFYIPVRRLCFPLDPEAQKQSYTRPCHAAQDKRPLLVDALEALRAAAMALQDPDELAVWKRRHRGGPRDKRLRVDSSSKWDSTFRLASMAVSIKDGLYAFSGDVEGFPTLPSPGGWHRLEALITVLSSHCLSNCVLQEDDARAAQIIPV